MDFDRKIRDYIQSLGFDTFGATKCRKFEEIKEKLELNKRLKLENPFEEEDIEKRINPFLLYEDGKSIISIAFPYLYPTKGEENPYFSKYTMGLDYHLVVKSYLNKILDYIKSLGGDGIVLVYSNPLPERYIAKLCGVGFIGKNNMIITEKYGSYVFLGEIITNIEMKYDISLDNKCEQCVKCIERCPTNSLNPKRKNSNICLSYITQKKDLEEKWFKVIDKRLFGCDTCQNHCPFNEGIEYSNIEEFKPKSFMKDPKVSEIALLNKSEFQEKYKTTSCGWRGKNILQRNALIVSYNCNYKLDIKDKDINSPYVKEYYEKVKNKIQR